MEYAGVWKRFVAVFVDGLVFVGAGFVLGLVVGAATAAAEDESAGSALFSTPLWIVIAFAYYVVCEASFGATIGKRAAGLRVVREDGSDLTWGRAFVRNLLRPVDALFFYLVALISMAFSSKEQRLGDRAAGTLVVRR